MIRSRFCAACSLSIVPTMGVRNILTKFDEPDIITGQTGTRARRWSASRTTWFMLPSPENANPTQLIGCAIDLLVVAYILKHGKP